MAHQFGIYEGNTACASSYLKDTASPSRDLPHHWRPSMTHHDVLMMSSPPPQPGLAAAEYTGDSETLCPGRVGNLQGGDGPRQNLWVCVRQVAAQAPRSGADSDTHRHGDRDILCPGPKVTASAGAGTRNLTPFKS